MRRFLRLSLAGVTTLVAGVATPLVLHGSAASAAAVDPAHVVVYRVGEAGGSLTNAAAPVFLDRYTTDGTLEGTVSVPTASSGAQHALTASGRSRSEGRLSLSPDGTLLAFTGYDAPVGTNGPDAVYTDVNGVDVHVTESLTASDPTTVGRVVGLLDGSQAVDTSTSVVGAGVPHVVRSGATPDGTRLYLGGSDGGVLTTTRGGSSATSVLSSPGLDATALAVAGNQLFATGGYDGQPGKRVVTVGAGAPTGASDVTGLAGLPANVLAGGFTALDLTGNGYGSTGVDTIYVANTAEKAGAIDKFVFDGTTWGKQGALPLDGVLAVAAKATGSTVQLVATTATGLWSFTENDGAAAGFATSAPSQVATAPAGSEFRGVALAPTGDALAKPTIAITGPAGGTHVASNATTLHVTGTASALRGIGSVSVSVDGGSPVAAAVSGAGWAADVPVGGLPAGPHTLSATAQDSAANPASATATEGIVRDPAPALAVSSPTASQHVSYLTGSIVVKGTSSAYRGIAQVTVQVDSGSPAAASLSGGVWSRSIAVNTLRVGTHAITVSARESSSGAVTTVTRYFIRDGVPAGTVGPGGFSYTNRLIVKSPGWTVVAYGLSPDRRALRTTGTSYVRFTSYGRGLDLHFQRRPDAGEVRVTIDGRVFILDLKSSATGDAVKAFRNLSAGKHSIVIQALHRHSAGSRGYVVLLGSLRVYA